MNNIIRVSFPLGLITLVTLLVGVIKTKVWAVYLGPYGLGLISQLYNYQLFLSLLASFGMAQGITKYVSEYQQANNKEGARYVLNTAISLSLLIALLSVIITITFANSISHLLLGNSALFLLVIIAVLGVPFQTVGETCLAFLQGSQGVREIVRANLLISGLGLASAIPLIIFFKLPGAVIHLMLLGAITYISFCWQARSLTVPLRLITVKNLKGIFNSELLKKLVNFGFLRLIQIAIGPVAILVVRSLVIRYQGASQNGIYQAASNFSVFFIPIILNVLWSYSYPGFCRAKTKEELTVEVNQFLRFALLISLPIIILILLVRYPLIRLVYAPTFKLAAAILPLQLLGDFLRVMSIPLGSALVSREMLTAGIKYEFIWNVAFVTAAFSLLPFFSLTVLLVAYVASYLLNFIMLYIHMAYFNGFKLSRRNLAIIVFSILLILVTGFLPLKKIVNFSLFVTIAVFWLSTSLSRMEARALLYRSLGFIKRERV